MAGSRNKPVQQPIYGAAIALSKPVRLDRDTVYAALHNLVVRVGARVRMIEEEPVKRGILSGLRQPSPEFTCEIGGLRMMVSASAKPLCNASTMHSFINPSIWRGSLGGMTGHRAHLLIAEVRPGDGDGDRDAMFDRATAVTLATAAIAGLVEAEGVIWLPARNAVPMGIFDTEMERFIGGEAPLRFWLRCQVLRPPVQEEREPGKLSGKVLHPGAATVGMSAFIGAEIVAPPSNCERDVMLDHIFSLASAVIDENSELRDGADYGKRGGNMVRLRLRKAGSDSDRPYWELLPRPAAASEDAAAPDADEDESYDDGAGPAQAPHLRLVMPGG